MKFYIFVKKKINFVYIGLVVIYVKGFGSQS